MRTLIWDIITAREFIFHIFHIFFKNIIHFEDAKDNMLNDFLSSFI